MAIDLFFYGTLRHLPLLEVVFGGALPCLSDAVLPDHEVLAVANAPFPMISERRGGRAEGVLLKDVTDQQLARLNFYEGGFEYDLRRVTLEDGTLAQVYFPMARFDVTGAWSFEEWVATWADMSVHAAREVMGHMGHLSTDEVANRFEMIRARATAQTHAARSRHGVQTTRGRVDIHERRRVYTGFYAFDEFTLQHETFAGGMSPVLERSAFIATDAAIVLPYDPVRDVVLLVEQMRMGPLARGDQSRWHLEPIAGRVDAGEAPADAAYREAREEADLELSALEAVAEAYASPGNATEFHYIFVGLADLPDRVAGVSGKPDEAEDIRSHIIGFDALMEMVDTFQAANAPLLVAALWLARHRDRLRNNA